jgi:hypothetical protein
MELLKFIVRNPLVLLDNNMTPQEIEYLKSQGVDPTQYEEVGEYEEVTPPAQQPQEQGIIGKAWETINTPVTAYAPDAFRNMVRQGISYNPLGDAIMRKVGVPDPVIRGVNNVESDIGESFLSPLSLATLGSAGLLRQVPRVAGALGGLFGIQSGYNLAQRPGQFAEAKGDLQKQTEAVLGGVADLASVGLGGLQAKAGYLESLKPPVIKRPKKGSVAPQESVVETGPKPTDPETARLTDEFYDSQINDPLPTPWTAEGSPEIAQTVQGLPKSGRLVSNKAVDALIQEKAPHLITASQAVKRQFLLDNQVQFADTPQFNRFEDGVQRSSEVETLVNKAGDKITRKPGINLEGQPTEFGPLEDTFRQPQPLKSNVETVLNEQGLPYTRPVVYPNEAKSALDIGVQQSNPESSYKIIDRKRPTVPLSATPEIADPIQPAYKTVVKKGIDQPVKTEPTPEFQVDIETPTIKPDDVLTGKEKLPIKYQDQFPKQSMDGITEAKPEIIPPTAKQILDQVISETDAKRADLYRQSAYDLTDPRFKELDLAVEKAQEAAKLERRAEIAKEMKGNPIKSAADKAQEGTSLHFGLPDVVKLGAEAVGKLHSVDPTRGQIDKVAQKQGPTGQYAAPKFEQFYERMRKYEGEFVNSLKSTLQKGLSFKQKLLSQSSPALTKAWQYLNDVQDFGRSALTLTPEEQGYVNAIRQNLQKTGQEQINKGIPVWTAKGPRTKVLDPNYVPHLFNKTAIETITNKQGSPEFTNLKNKMIAYWKTRHGFTQDQATKVFNEIAESFKSTDESNKASTFGPVDKAAGLGLPIEAREMNPILAMDRFNKRISRRFAFFDAIESDPVMRKALGIKFDHLGNPTPSTVKLPSGLDVDYIGASDEVSPIMRDIEAKHAIRDIEFDALNTTLKSVVMQTLSGGVDFVTSNILGWQHQLPTQYAKATIKGISDLSKSIAEGLNEGVIRHDTVSYESTSGAIGDVIGNLQKLRTAAGMITLRNTFEKMGRGVAFGQGKLLAADNVYKLHRNPNGLGSSQRKLFMDTFAKDINWKGRAQLTPEEISTIAGRYTESVAGTYDYRGLSALTQDSRISPLLNWSRWSIEKKNNFIKNVVKPLENGNYWPLIGATAGLMIGGTAVQELRKLASGGREAKSPTWKEIDKAEDRKGEALFYKLASLADASGYGGIHTSIAHNLMKVRFGDKPQAMFDLPLAEFAKDNTTLLLQAVEAFEAGDLEGVDLLIKFAEANIQNARILTSLLSEDKKKSVEHSNKTRDYKMFKELTGQHRAYDTSTPNPFLGKKEKEFKRAGVDQLGQLPKLLNDAVANSVRKAEGDPFKISTNLRGLKSNPITWSPSMENNPLEFTKYIKHLKETQGPKAASEFIQNYMKQKKLNEAKSSLVPSFSP